MICLLQTPHFTFFKKNVLWFQVSMDDILSVDSYGKLNEIKAHKILKSVPPLKWSLPFEKDPLLFAKMQNKHPTSNLQQHGGITKRWAREESLDNEIKWSHLWVQMSNSRESKKNTYG